jgi:hypothetical protein
MKLLYEHNLPPLLVSRLADLFPHSQHVFALGLDQVSDTEIRDYARQNDFCIVTKDADSATFVSSMVFRRRSFGFVEEIVRYLRLKKFCVSTITTFKRWKSIR